MSKAIKFKNNMYLDSRGAVHNGTILKTYLDNMNTNITNLSNKIINPSIGINGTSDYTIPAPGGSFTNYQQYAFNNTYFNNGNTFSRNGSTIVANKKCLALVMFSINFDGDETIQCNLRKNYSAIFTVDSYAHGMTNTNPVQILVSLNAGDILDINVGFGRNASHLTRRDRSYMNVIALG